MLPEDALDALDAAGPRDFPAPFRTAVAVLRARYRAEESWLDELPARLRDKLSAQHAEVLELAAALEASLAEGRGSEAAALLDRFRALARHNLIEKERDVIPYYDQRI